MNNKSLSMPESLNRIIQLFIKYKFLCQPPFKKKQTLILYRRSKTRFNGINSIINRVNRVNIITPTLHSFMKDSKATSVPASWSFFQDRRHKKKRSAPSLKFMQAIITKRPLRKNSKYRLNTCFDELYFYGS